MSFITRILHQIIWGWTNYRGWDTWNM